MPSGVVVSYDRRKGFGFIHSPDFPKDVFVHAESVQGRVVLREGQRVQFAVEETDRGLRAIRVVPGRVGLSPTMVAAGLLIASLVGVTWGLHRAGLGWGGAYFGAIGVATCATYAWDKRQAKRGGRRVPEADLLALALFGGSPAALVAMLVLRHKTSKMSFQVKFFGVLVVQALALGAWWWVEHR